MKNIVKVNLGSLIVFLLSFTVWFFLVNDYNKLNNGREVSVQGVRKQNTLKKTNRETRQSEKSSILEQAVSAERNFPQQDDKEKEIIPIKKKDVGNTYVRAKGAVAIDVNSESILYQQNADKKLPIASLTKLMTALVVLDNIKNLKEETVVIDKEVCDTPTSKIGCPSSTYCFSKVLQKGEKVRAEDLLEAMLVNSANDAAVALGKHIAGSQEKFANLMNKKAKEVGLKNTHFCNPSGLDDENSANKCYSTAHDVAQLVVYALKSKRYNDLQRIFKIKEKWFNSVDGKLKHRFASTNILLDTMPNCLGAKTGFTYEAGKTLMMIANKPDNKDIKVVIAILNDPYRFDDAKSLFDWIFKNYEWKEKDSFKK